MSTYRYICDVVEEMRECCKTLNFSTLRGLIAEIHSMGKRMEAGLQHKNDWEYWREKHQNERNEAKRLLKVTNKMRKEAGEEPKKFDDWKD